ncbi:hypothetical protein RB3372 [Rhodopirellula baltica SH 1]|uniref:Uncharacterized protein n=1 Tax=Rhodopirellula baltica (strain DSM 10527 / NCIMB 13988 / SH1) TaxID=243090 RepID=Q7UUC6_RHOBA|nr:hypothetical protein RB3372 [Rhodopirellula baltica SH 1]
MFSPNEPTGLVRTRVHPRTLDPITLKESGTLPNVLFGWLASKSLCDEMVIPMVWTLLRLFEKSTEIFCSFQWFVKSGTDLRGTVARAKFSHCARTMDCPKKHSGQGPEVMIASSQ